jgi:hypothetical protein
MTASRDPDRLINAFLHEGAEQLNDRVYDDVRAEIEQKRQRVVIGPWRVPTMNKLVPIGLGAAAVVVAVVVGSRFLGPPAPTGVGTAPSPRPSATPAASVAVATPQPTPEGQLAEGPFLMLTGQNDAGEFVHPPLTVTIPSDRWRSELQGIMFGVAEPAGAEMIIFGSDGYNVYGDPCHWQTTMPDKPVTTVDDFVAALSAQPGRDASAPVEITLDGYTGKAITLHVPDDLSACDQGTFGSWDCGDPGEPAACGFNHPGEISVDYILDVDGVLMAWHTDYWAETPADLVAELEAIVRSATFGEAP